MEDAVISVGQQKLQELVVAQWVSFCRKTDKPATQVSMYNCNIGLLYKIHNVKLETENDFFTVYVTIRSSAINRLISGKCGPSSYIL